MPMKEGKSKSAISKNIAMLVEEGKSRSQAIAIALGNAGVSKEMNQKTYLGLDEEKKFRGGNLKERPKRMWPDFK